MFALYGIGANAQVIAVKSDLLSGALTSPNIGVELKLSKYFSIENTFHWNPLSRGSAKRWKHWYIQPELRYWGCQPFAGHYVGLHVIYGVFNVGNMKLPFELFKGVRSYRYEGEVYGVGAGYGYNYIISPHWSLELEFGLGYLHAEYGRYNKYRFGEHLGNGCKNYPALTRLSLTFVYIIR